MDQMLLVSNNVSYSSSPNPCRAARIGQECPPSMFPSEGECSPPSPDADLASCPFLTLCTGGGARHRTRKTNKKHLRLSFFRRGQSFLKKGESSDKELEVKGSGIKSISGAPNCRESKSSESDTMGSGCQCRKCSLISLGDVDTREVHSMIKFIKQNKVAFSSDWITLFV